MRRAQNFHNNAMQKADEALAAAREGDSDASLQLFASAAQLELLAAQLTKQQPSRAILFRSAANLALEAKKFDVAERCACFGLIGYPPADVAEELRHALDRATFNRHLEIKGIELSSSSVQLIVAGPSVGYGDAPEMEVMTRVDAYRKLISRAANRMRGVPYSDSPSPRSELSSYQLFLSTPRAASFAVTLRVGSRQMQQHLSFDVSADQVVEDVFTNLQVFESGQVNSLRNTIPETEYRRNFIALARRLSPDGDRITTVGLTKSDSGVVEALALRLPRSAHIDRRSRSRGVSTAILDGRLSFADSRGKRKSGKIILTSGNLEYSIAVPKGILADIVRPHFDQQVQLRARQRVGGAYEFIEFIDH